MLPQSMADAAVTELRQYALFPGARQALVDVFEAELLDPQEAVGMRVGGTFTDGDDPDRFVWFRGFSDMDQRRRALHDFYGGPVWAEHAGTANATMRDSDNVLMLRPTVPPHPLSAPCGKRQPIGSSTIRDDWVVVEVWQHQPDTRLEERLATIGHTAISRAVQAPVATWRSEPSENNFPRLPVREGSFFVWTATFPSHSTYESAVSRLRAAEGEPDLSELLRSVTARQRLRLQPTARSQHSCP